MRAQGSEVVRAARRWIGTPYHHQAATRGAGCDCLGLVRGLWRELVGPEPFRVPAYTPDWSEPEGDEVLWTTACKVMREKPLADAAPGDVVLFRMRAGGVAKHLGVLSRVGDAPSFIHAYQGHGVVESPLSAPWQSRIVGCFALPV
ncbi:MAG: NlpC/P60 family protein [Rhodobacteraceae bacterium]|nr:NlpC/P60 family protein [Paracoccaceae bacterium]